MSYLFKSLKEGTFVSLPCLPEEAFLKKAKRAFFLVEASTLGIVLVSLLYVGNTFSLRSLISLNEGICSLLSS